MVNHASATLAEEVAAQVRSWIRDGTLLRDELYSVQQLADRFEVSRSPVREGLLALAESGLIEFTRNRGFRIVVPGARDVAEIFALRLALEPAAARRAAAVRSVAGVDRLTDAVDGMTRAAGQDDSAAFAQHDQALHHEIMRIAGNGRATAVIEELRDVTRALGPSTMGRSRSLTDILGEHQPFVDAIVAGNAARAEMSMHRHLVATGRLLVQQCWEDGDSAAFEVWEDVVDEDR
ncbi:GntR family transcriptional regulator [Leekyejoonella antrihumi]|nr:GntR family transcriptional regulator [Leekyejoonella antrihumi]